MISLNQLVKWLAQQAEARGIDLLAGFPGAEMLYEGDRVVGVRTGDKGIDKHGKRKPNFEPGVDLRAKVTILAEGARGSLTKQLVPRLKLDEGKFPMVYSIGVKELWEVPKGRLAKGAVIHTMGFPLDSRTFGGGFIYGFTDERISVGLVVGLDYHDPVPRPARALPELQGAPAPAGRCWQAGRWCATERARSARAAGTRSRGPTRTACCSSGRRPAT